MKILDRIFLMLAIGLIFSNCTKDKVAMSELGNCDETISFASDVMPIITANCTSCHNVGNSTGYTLTNHANVSANVDAIIGAMRANGFQLMPQGGPALPDSLIQKINCWKNQGVPNN